MRDRFREQTVRAKPIHPYAWLWEPLESDRTFVLRSMFGAKAVYLDGKLMLCFCARDEPWHGVLVCTEQSHHESLLAEFPALVPHPVLPKWLYLPDAIGPFEKVATRLVLLAKLREPRLGVISHPKKKSRRPLSRQRP
jgi:hypothetical protein